MLPKIKPVKTVSRIRSKGPRVKDPIRFPRVIEPIEKQFTDSYLKMMNTQTVMIQLEMLNQVKK
jgi:hypothetical protein